MRSVVVALALAAPLSAAAEEDAKPDPNVVTPDRSGGTLRIPKPTQGPFAEPSDQPRKSRTPALIATVATGTLIAASIASWYHYDQLASDTADAGGFGFMGETRADQQDRIDRTQRWKHISLGVFAAAVISCGVTGYMWSRLDNVPKMSIEPTNSSIRVSYNMSF